MNVCVFSRRNFPRNSNIDPHTGDMKTTNIKCSELRLARKNEIREISFASPNKSCKLDPIPTWLIKKCVDLLLPFPQQLINTFLSTGCFPDELNVALIKPHIKKINLDTNHQLMNYLAVYNLHCNALHLDLGCTPSTQY